MFARGGVLHSQTLRGTWDADKRIPPGLRLRLDSGSQQPSARRPEWVLGGCGPASAPRASRRPSHALRWTVSSAFLSTCHFVAAVAEAQGDDLLEAEIHTWVCGQYRGSDFAPGVLTAWDPE